MSDISLNDLVKHAKNQTTKPTTKPAMKPAMNSVPKSKSVPNTETGNGNTTPQLKELRKVVSFEQSKELFRVGDWKKIIKKRKYKTGDRVEIRVELTSSTRPIHTDLVNSLLSVYAEEFKIDISKKKELSDFRKWLITYLLVQNLPCAEHQDLKLFFNEILGKNPLFKEIMRRDQRNGPSDESNIQDKHQQLEDMQQTNLANQRAISLILASVLQKTSTDDLSKMSIDALLSLDSVLNVQNGVRATGESEQKRLKTLKNKPRYR